MMTFETVLRLFADLQADELERWIAERWVLPESDARGYLFQEVDVARIRLIVDLRHDLAIGEEALPLVLNLLDQVYALRRRLRALCDALETQPPEIRDAVLGRMRAGESSSGR